MATTICKLLTRLTLSCPVRKVLTNDLPKSGFLTAASPALANCIRPFNPPRNLSILQKANFSTANPGDTENKDLAYRYRFDQVEDLKSVDNNYVKRIFSTEFARQSDLNRIAKHNAIKKYQKHSNDYGSTPVQVAMLTTRIHRLRYHVSINKKDKHNRRRLLMMIDKRKKHLAYLKRTDFKTYCKLLEELLIRPTIKYKYGNMNPLKSNRPF